MCHWIYAAALAQGRVKSGTRLTSHPPRVAAYSQRLIRGEMGRARPSQINGLARRGCCHVTHLILPDVHAAPKEPWECAMADDFQTKKKKEKKNQRGRGTSIIAAWPSEVVPQDFRITFPLLFLKQNHTSKKNRLRKEGEGNQAVRTVAS